jgi:WD40 repeat protein
MESGLPLAQVIRVWDAETGEVVAGPFNGHDGSVHSVAFSPDGKQIVSCSHDKTVRVWDAETGEVVTGPFNGHNGEVNSVVFPPDGMLIVSGSNDQMISVSEGMRGHLSL